MELREYQKSLIEKLRNAMKFNKKIIMQLGTGGGKTICFTYMAKNAYERGKKILILTDRGELLEQAGGSFNKFNLPHGWFTSESKQIPHENVVISMVETLDRRLNGKRGQAFQMWVNTFDLVIVDEVHKGNFNKVLEKINKNTFIIGATATPYRTGKMQPLRTYFDEIVEGESIISLINLGFLAKPEYYGIPTDLTGVKKLGGEFKPDDIDRVFSDPKTYIGLTANYNRLIEGRKTMIFAPSRIVACIVIDELKKVANCPVYYVDGSISKSERENVLSEFYNAYPAIMVNIGVLTTGYDCPSVDTIVLYRATTSLPLYLQMCGRGSRTTVEKDTFRIIDFGQNVNRHGMWHENRKWSLDNDKIPKEGVAPVKNCPKCLAIIAASCMNCMFCGHKFENKTKQKKQVVVELEHMPSIFDFKKNGIEYSVYDLEKTRVEKGYKIGFVLFRLLTLDRFKEYAKMKGYKRGWAEFNYELYKSKQNETFRG